MKKREDDKWVYFGWEAHEESAKTKFEEALWQDEAIKKMMEGITIAAAKSMRGTAQAWQRLREKLGDQCQGTISEHGSYNPITMEIRFAKKQ